MSDYKETPQPVDIDPLMPVDVIRPTTQREHMDSTALVQPQEPAEDGDLAIENQSHKCVGSLNLVGNVEPVDEEE